MARTRRGHNFIKYYYVVGNKFPTSFKSRTQFSTEINMPMDYVDTGIRDIVRWLNNVAGLSTFASCEGHVKRHAPYQQGDIIVDKDVSSYVSVYINSDKIRRLFNRISKYFESIDYFGLVPIGSREEHKIKELSTSYIILEYSKYRGRERFTFRVFPKWGGAFEIFNKNGKWVDRRSNFLNGYNLRVGTRNLTQRDWDKIRADAYAWIADIISDELGNLGGKKTRKKRRKRRTKKSIKNGMISLIKLLKKR